VISRHLLSFIFHPRSSIDSVQELKNQLVESFRLLQVRHMACACKDLLPCVRDRLHERFGNAVKVGSVPLADDDERRAVISPSAR
jgi:hypothetical protein